MGRVGQKVLKDEDGLGDRVSIGLLARAFPRATVEAVIEAAGAREQRTRMLPSWLVVYYVLALALFMDMGGGRVMRKLAGTLSWAARGPAVVLPSEEALSRARARLGPGPLRLLFESVAGPLACPDTRAVSGGAGGCSAWMAPPWMCRTPRRTGPASGGRVPAMSPAPGCGAGSPRSGWWLWPSAAPGR